MNRTRNKVTLENAQKFAAKFGGKCISKKCIKAKERLLWECRNGHRWEAIYDSVRRGSWCPECAGLKKLTIESARATARDRGGRCLSTKYINGKTLMDWECKDGHRWSARYNSVRNGTWCEKCVRSGAGQTIKEMRILAKMRGGRCLSKKYTTARTPIKWQCKQLHNSWMATPDEVKRGRWCPECSKGLGERICRTYFESIFSTQFPTVRPDFLKNPKTGVNFELDGFSDKLKLAFEHHGRQHYKDNSYFSAGNKLKERQSVDAIKKKMCKKAGITLIEIPSVPDMLSLKELENFLRVNLLKYGFKITDRFDFNTIDLSNTFSPDFQGKLSELQKYCKSKGGRLISDHYLGSHVKLKFQCRLKHVPWFATPAKILSAGRWCPDCGGRKKKTLNDVLVLANSLNFELLSKKYINGKSKLKWKCRKGHIWNASFDSVNRGSRCPVCFNIWRKSGYKENLSR